MKSPDKWITGWDRFLKRKTRGLSKVDLRLIRQLQVEYIGMIQKDARNNEITDRLAAGTKDFMKPKSQAGKTSAKLKRRKPVQCSAMVGRKALVHAIANCLDCDWEAQDYLTTQKQARSHVQTTGHRVSMDLGYAVTISPNK